MTEEQITAQKIKIAREMEQALDKFVGMAMSDVTISLAKSKIKQHMDHLLSLGYSIVEVLDFETTVNRGQLIFTLVPKKGLSQDDLQRAVDFIDNKVFF